MEDKHQERLYQGSKLVLSKQWLSLQNDLLDQSLQKQSPSIWTGFVVLFLIVGINTLPIFLFGLGYRHL
jgi:hypothetical protein